MARLETGEHYWISGPRRDGADRLYAGGPSVDVDEDARDVYWSEVRGRGGS